MSVHRAALGFDSAAGVYDRVRPGYPPALFVAQGFHWFANDAALSEIPRVLRPHVCELFAFRRVS